MRRILHVARETLRAAFRSRLAVSLLVMLALILVVLPYAVGGNGTFEEARRLALTWTLGLSAIVLSAATLWAGCGAISGEREERTWPSVEVTPTPTFFVWLGKWAGLVALDALLLVPVLVGASFQLRHRMGPEDRLRPFERIAPEPESIRANAERYCAAALKSGAIPPDSGHTPEEWTEHIFQDLMSSPLSLSSGQSFFWEFSLPASAAEKAPPDRAYLTLTLVSPYGTATEIAGTLELFLPDGTVCARRDISPSDDRVLRLEVPEETLAAHPGRLRLLFSNTGPRESHAALFHPAEDVALFVPHGTFAGNLVRVGMVLLAMLSVLSAVGVACGSLLSRPVAIFAATGIVLLGLLSHSDLNDEGVGCCDDPVAATSPGHAYAVRARRVLEGIATLTKPLDDAAPLDRAGDGLLVPTRPLVLGLLLDGLALPLAIGLGASALLRRREDDP